MLCHERLKAMKYPLLFHLSMSWMRASFYRCIFLKALKFGLTGFVLAIANPSRVRAEAPGQDTSYWLYTGSNQPLSGLSLPLEILPLELAPLLLFDVGFASQETASPATIHDSFSVSLANKTQSNTVVLLSADAYGFIWAPGTPGGLTLNSNAVVYRDISFPSGNSLPASAFSVAIILPPEFAGQDATLYLDLYDNRDGQDSMAYIDRLRVESGVPPLFLQSATKVLGPFVDEDGIAVDRRLRTITVPKRGQNRFFRLKANAPVAVRQTRFLPDRVVFQYEFLKPLPAAPIPAVLAVESSPKTGGPYGEESGITVQPTEQTVTLWWGRTMRFYRIRADVARRIVQQKIQGDNLILSYE
jgi:hypothetical protein